MDSGLSQSEAVPLGEDRDGAEVDVQLITGKDFRPRRLGFLGRRQKWGYLPKVVLKAGRRDDFQQAGRLVASFPWPVGFCPRLTTPCRRNLQRPKS